MTVQTQLILRALLSNPTQPTWGRQLAEKTGLMSGTIQPILKRLDAAGWVDSERESPEQAHAEGRPPRRYYVLTNNGAQAAIDALSNAPRLSPDALRGLAGEAGL